MTLPEELMERARSYEQSGSSAQHTADLLRRAALRIDRLSSIASPLDFVEAGDADAARSAALEEAARVADVNGIAEGEMVRIDDDPFDAADAVGKRIAAAIRELRVTGAESNP